MSVPGARGQVSRSQARSQSRSLGKARFDTIYDRPDPRAYFERLAPLRYEIPHHAQETFRRTATARATLYDGRNEPPAVLDLCCSYGINAALLNHDVTLDELYDHYTGDDALSLTTDELAARDKEFYAERRLPRTFPVYGLDIAGRAVDYAQRAGLLDGAFTDNLEQGLPGPELRRALDRVGLITLTGGGSYLTERTFTALLGPVRRPLWVSAFVLRTVSYAPIARVLAGHGLTTTADPTTTYPQRRFTDDEEQRYAIEAVRALGGDPRGREEEGWFHTVLYESGPGRSTGA